MSVSSFETGEGFSPQAQNCVCGENPSSGASRHLLPRGEKEEATASLKRDDIKFDSLNY